jgi:hypothetical protein
MMGELDGNAIAGTLFTVFGREMTTAAGICTSCGTRSQLAELTVICLLQAWSHAVITATTW